MQIQTFIIAFFLFLVSSAVYVYYTLWVYLHVSLNFIYTPKRFINLFI